MTSHATAPLEEDDDDANFDFGEIDQPERPDPWELTIQRRFARAMKRSKRQLAARLVRAATAINVIDREYKRLRARLAPFDHDESESQYRRALPSRTAFWRDMTMGVLHRRRDAVVELTDAVVYAWEAGFERTEIQTIVRRVTPGYNFHVSSIMLGDDAGRFFRRAGAR